MAGSDRRRGKTSSFPDPLELERLDASEEDPSVFDRVTAVPGETQPQRPARARDAEEDPVSGLQPRSTPEDAMPSFREPIADDDLPPVLAPAASGRGAATSAKPAVSRPADKPASARPKRPVLELELDDIEPQQPPVRADRSDTLEIELPQRPPSPPLSAPGANPNPELSDMRGRYATGDFTGALVVAESILEATPDHEEARRCHDRCTEVLSQMYLARLGSPAQVVYVVLPNDQIRWLSLDHRAGFLLSLVDGTSTIEELLDISGMTRLDALRILYGLLDQRVIGLRGKG